MSERRRPDADGQAGDQAATRQSFSAVVKAASHASHLAAERCFQPFLRDPARHLAGFLHAQLAAHQALLAACPRVDPAAPGLVAGLTEDCRAADRGAVAAHDVQLRAPRDLHPTAVNYLVFGGRNGAAVIRRLLQRVDDLAVPAHFDEDPAYAAAWQTTLADLDAIAQGSDTARIVLRDIEAGFCLFAQAAAACLDPTPRTTT